MFLCFFVILLVSVTVYYVAICDSFVDISIDEFPLDFLVLDNDLLSLEMPLFYQDFYQVKKETFLHRKFTFLIECLCLNLTSSHLPLSYCNFI